MTDRVGKRSVTLRDIAEAVGVSRQVVATVLAGHGSARAGEETRERIVKAAAEMGYRPHGPARSLATGRTHTIELQSHSIGRLPFHMPWHHMAVWSAVSEVCREHSYQLLLVSREDEQKEISLRNLYERNVDGVILMGVSDLSVLQTAREASIPVICVNPEMARDLLVEAGFSVVDFDNVTGIKLAIQNLRDLGHTKIGFVRGRASNQDFEERWRAYWKIMNACGLQIRQEWTWETMPTFSGGHQVGRQFLAMRGERPTAVLAACDALALGMLNVLLEAGVSVPEEVSLMGFDDVEAASIVFPGLSTVHLDWMGLGRMGAERLFDMLSAPNGTFVPTLTRFPVHLMHRRSCGVCGT